LIKRRKFPRIFFGWWTVMSTGLLSMWAGGYQVYGFSALFKPISSELGLSRVVMSIPSAISRFEGGFEAPISGWITDRYGPRWIALFGVFVIGLGLILMNFVNSLWAFCVVWGVILGSGHNIGTTIPLDKAITDWFVKKRGVALGTKIVFRGLSGVLVLPLIAWLIMTQGWRMTCVVGGLVMWVVGLPLTWFFIKTHRPEYYGLLPDGATTEEEAESSQMIDRGVEYAAEVEELEFTLRQVMRTPSFWVLMAANAIHSMAMPAISIHGIPFITDMGIDTLMAAGILAMMVSVSIPFRLIGGLLADRVSRRHLRFIIAGAYSMQALGFTVFLLNQTTAMIYVWFVLYGIGVGIAYTILPALRARYFGRKAYGSIQGFSSLFMMPIGIAAPIYCGWVYDTTGNYITAFTLITGLLVISVVLACFILPPKPPAQVTDVRKIV